MDCCALIPEHELIIFYWFFLGGLLTSSFGFLICGNSVYLGL